MKILVILLSIYSVIVTGFLAFNMNGDIDEIRDIADFSLGDNWRGVQVKDVIHVWNNNHPKCHINQEQNLYDLGHEIKKELEITGGFSI